MFGVLGPNGAGKSTLVGMFTTTIVPTAGTARVAGHDVARQPLLVRGASSVVFQEPVVDATLTGRANLELHARLWGVPWPRAERRMQELTEVAGARGAGPPAGARPIAAGQRRRLEIARALISEPQVLFLDEPTVGLDPRIRHELLDVIAGLRARIDLTILITTHYLEEAQRLCDRVAIVHDGSVVALASPQSLLAGLGEEILEFRVHDEPHATLAASPGPRDRRRRRVRDRRPPDRARCAVAPRATRSPRSRPSACARRRSRRGRRRSTTSTCN